MNEYFLLITLELSHRLYGCSVSDADYFSPARATDKLITIFSGH